MLVWVVRNIDNKNSALNPPLFGYLGTELCQICNSDMPRTQNTHYMCFTRSNLAWQTMQRFLANVGDSHIFLQSFQMSAAILLTVLGNVHDNKVLHFCIKFNGLHVIIILHFTWNIHRINMDAHYYIKQLLTGC